jgi:PPP family 3-phenylpropionic acid transporter
VPASPALRLGIFLCAVFAAGGVSSAFLALWMADRGLSAAEIGTVLSLAAAARALAAPLWGRLADALPLRVALTAGAATALVGNLVLAPAAGFWPVLLAVMLQSAGASALMPLADAVSLALTQQGRLDYGRVRAAASAAFMAANALGGVAVGAAGLFLVPLLMAGAHALATAMGPALPHTGTPPSRQAGFFASLALLRRRGFLLTVLASAIIQGSHAAYYTLAALHWRAAGHSETVIGLLWAASLLAETLLFLLARPLLTRVLPGWLTAIAAGACALRWTVLGLTTWLPALVAIQALHALTYGFQHLSAMQMLGRTVSPERAGSAQTLHATLGGTVSLGVITWLAGRSYDGTGLIFLVMAALATTALPLAAALGRLPR